MKKTTLLLIFIFLIFPTLTSAASPQKSIVKIFVAANQKDLMQPWQSRGVSLNTGSGVIIDDNKILTNAHVVNHSTFIQVKKIDDPKKYTARLEAIGNDCDLALLVVEDPTFFEGSPPLKIGDLPDIQDTVTVMGFPKGGDEISITEGVVSRIEMTPYAQSGRNLLTVQIDAAINSGNSGGPVLLNNKIVGIAMQTLNSGQNIGYMIPTPVINHFFKDLEDGDYDGFPILGVEYENTQNINLRNYFGLTENSQGVLISHVNPTSPASQALRQGDILLEVDGIKIGQDATFNFRQKTRLNFSHLITMKQVDETMNFKIKRDNQIQDISLQLNSFTQLIPYPNHFQQAPYYILNGIVFSVVTTDLLKSWGKRWWEQSPLHLKYYLMGKGRHNDIGKTELITILGLLPHETNAGFENSVHDVVMNLNGREFTDFAEFVKIIEEEKQTAEILLFETLNHAKIFLPTENIDLIDTEIFERYEVRDPYSFGKLPNHEMNQP